ncbi:MAG: glycosyltransferase family 4 protein [Candidatus Moraniibacteriota bacterium]
MGLFWINVGKAWSLIREEGILRGGRRIFSYATRLFSRVPPGDILIVTGGVGDSARYRAHHVAEELNLHGIQTSVTHQDNPFLTSYANRFSVFIFHRTLFTSRVEKLFTEVKKLEKEIIFETDDLVYDPQYIQQTAYYQKMNALQQELYEKGVGAEILRDSSVKVCTTTTSFLAKKLGELGKQVFIVPNKLSKQDMEWIRKIPNTIRQLTDQIPNTISLGYFSGTASHDADFATITEALLRVMEARPAVKLVIAGPLVLDDAFAPFRERIIRLPFASRREHFENIASIDINLAPLVIGDPFCESKSELKFVEAGACGIPTIASATQTFREAIVNGEDGLVAVNTDEWKEKLLRLIDDEQLRKDIGEAARKKAFEQYTTERSNNESYYNYLRRKI